ncbi:hypothetical protein, partial [Stenotrophomonas geniculata]|uniref:hypothetical protein n=1 Tax=Stenotrophomonas geniculata TaxID=86188 RepID=UPI0039C5B618
AVKDSYYDLAEDRPIELQQHNLKAWSLGQQHAEEARQVSKAEIPKAVKDSYYDLAEDRPIELQQHNLKAW